MSQQVIDKVRCPLCVEEGRDKAGDNVHIFESGFANCVAGHGSLGKLDKLNYKYNNTTNIKRDIMPKKIEFKQGVYADIKSRNISKKTCEYYGYMVNYEDKCHIANYYDTAGNVIMQQIRTADKKFPIIGNKEGNEQLWGAHLFTPSDNVFITITEGQIDALSVAQSFNCKYPVVSIPNGVSAAKKVILKNKKYLDGFKYVVLAFDNDDPGRKATEDCLKVLEPGKVRVARWSNGKDANEMLQRGGEADIREAIYKSVEYIPEPIMTGEALLSSLDRYQSKTIPWPFKGASDIESIRIPAVYSIVGREGIGKTKFVEEIIRSIIGNGGRIGVITLEQTMQQALLNQTDALLGTKLSEVRNREFTEEEKEQCRMVSNNIVIYNHIQYGCDLSTIVDNIPYMVRSLGCQLIIFDNITYSLGGTQGDERRGIDMAMTKLKDSTVKYDYTIFNLGHIKREDNFKTYDDEDFPLSVEDIRGSQGIALFSDYIIGLHRDKSNENVTIRNTLKAKVFKDRFSGNDVGKQFSMKFDNKTKRFV